MRLEGITCLVTGANRGIGLAIARRLAREKVRLLVGVRELDRYVPIEPAGALEIRPVRMDLSSQADIDACCDELGEELGEIGLLVNNAGRFTAGQLEYEDVDKIYEVVQATMLGTMHLTRRVLPGMLEHGRGKIVNNSSIVAYAHFPGVTTYAAAKAGVSGFTESLHRELAGTPVSTLHVVTGGIDTDMLDAAKGDLRDQLPGADSWVQHTPDEWAEEIVKAILSDDRTLGPGGKSALAKLASHLPPFVLDTVTRRAFERRPAP
jgi:short-subunit dehydrogenase